MVEQSIFTIRKEVKAQVRQKVAPLRVKLERASDKVLERLNCT